MQGTLEEAFEEGKRLAMQAGKKWSWSFNINHISAFIHFELSINLNRIANKHLHDK
jgi:hypothetical protein